jgi:hypothetical protein
MAESEFQASGLASALVNRGGAMRGSGQGPGPLQYTQLRKAISIRLIQNSFNTKPVLCDICDGVVSIKAVRVRAPKRWRSADLFHGSVGRVRMVVLAS